MKRVHRVWDVIQNLYCSEFSLKYPAVLIAIGSIFIVKEEEHSPDALLAHKSEKELAASYEETKSGASGFIMKREIDRWPVTREFLVEFRNHAVKAEQMLEEHVNKESPA